MKDLKLFHGLYLMGGMIDTLNVFVIKCLIQEMYRIFLWFNAISNALYNVIEKLLQV